MKMSAAVLYELGGRLEIEELELEPPKEDEVLVKVAAAGVCHSDLSVIDGVIPWPLPSVLNQSQGGNYILERWQRHGRCKHQCVGSGL